MKIYTDMTLAPPLIREFITYLGTIRNLSKRTLEGYYIDLRTFFRFYKRYAELAPSDTPLNEVDIGDISFEMLTKITQRDIYEYLDFLLNERENSANSRARKLASLRTFFKYYTTKTYPRLDRDPVKDIDVPKIRQSLPKYLSLDESRRLLFNIRETDMYLRDYCIITLFLNCGMRLTELVDMNLSSIEGDTARIIGKGDKERQVFLNEACLDAIQKYIPVRNKYASPSEPDALFVSMRGSRISPRRVQQIVEEAVMSASLQGKKISAHKLRHTAATLMYRYGEADMLALKEILGHEHVSTTEIYTHISDEQLRKAATSSPLSGIKSDISDDETD